MTPTGVDASTEREELARLRVRVGALEEELLETQAKANETVAYWQDRAYWLERWHLDLNALMRKPGASELRAALRGVRSVVRLFVRLKRHLTQP